MTATIETDMTAEQLRAGAAERERSAQESFDRCGTDGFLSQWASGITAQKMRTQATIVENGGVMEFAALFDLDGNLVPAKQIKTRFGTSWALLNPADHEGRFLGFFNPSKARNGARRLTADRAKGYTIGTVLAPAYADIAGSGTGLSGAASCYVTVRRSDGGFSDTATVVATVSERYSEND